ncbi:MAG: hypothetical protein PHU23_06160 [Dehalococcoidales bacterium]|nr:hypothetical protein [Dehalococcoidales bacterium]
MKEFNEVIKFKTIPITFMFHCTLCNYEITDYDRHFGLIRMNEHVIAAHPTEVHSLDKEDLYSRKPAIVLEDF